MQAGAAVESLSGLDACVLAVGPKGLKAIVPQSPALARLAPELAAASTLGSVDVVAVRLWLDRTVPTATPANVFSRSGQTLTIGLVKP